MGARLLKTRKFIFGTNDDMRAFQISNNPLISTFYYTISIGFPFGERLMVDTARHYLGDIEDRELKYRARGFIGQESHHANASEVMNGILNEFGFDTESVEKNIAESITCLFNGKTWEYKLEFHTAFEHMATVLSSFIVANKDRFNDMPNNARCLMLWHCIEEIEHKDVMFDIARYFFPSRKIKRKALIDVLYFMSKSSIDNQWRLMKDVNCRPNRKEIWEAIGFFFGRNGLVRSIWKDTFRYMRKDFHPNDIDHSHLIENWEEKFPEIAKSVL